MHEPSWLLTYTHTYKVVMFNLSSSSQEWHVGSENNWHKGWGKKPNTKKTLFSPSLVS